MTSITNKVLKFNVAEQMPTGAETDSEGAKVSFSGTDDSKVLLILTNCGEAATTATIKKGNALQGVSDLEIALGVGATKVIAVESGRYSNVSGDNSGSVIITGDDVEVSAIVLP